MIINQKIKIFLNGNLENLKIVMKNKIEKDEKIRIVDILKNFSLKELDYSFEDFTADGYGENAKEKKVLYKIFFMGYHSVNEYCKQNGIETGTFFSCIRNGFRNERGNALLKQSKIFLSLLEIEYNLENIELEFYKKHIELYGEKEVLEKFRKFHEIRYPVRFEPVKEKWHLAFSGVLAEYIRYREYAERKKRKA